MTSAPHRTSRPATLLLATALLALAGQAWAHASLVRSEPPANAHLGKSPAEVVLEFNEGLEQKFSSLTVADAHGKVIAKVNGDAAAADARLLRLALPLLQKGDYQVQWSALTPDGHRRKGQYGFTVQ